MPLDLMQPSNLVKSPAITMETKLCRICGRMDTIYVHIFRTEGLRTKIETCLPIVVSPHCLLPDTICGECAESFQNFYGFIKNCMQSILILEAQYDITESCLKTKRKHDKSCLADIGPKYVDAWIQTDDQLEMLLKESESLHLSLPEISAWKHSSLVDYDLCSDSDEERDQEQKPLLAARPRTPSALQNIPFPVNRETSHPPPLKQCNPPPNENVASQSTPSLPNLAAKPAVMSYFADSENYLINEIAQRKKRKFCETEENSDTVTATLQPSRPKIFKMDPNGNRRKSRAPVKVERLPEASPLCDLGAQLPATAVSPPPEAPPLTFSTLARLCERQENGRNPSSGVKLPAELDDSQIVCLLCNQIFPSVSKMAAHLYQAHDINMTALAEAACAPLGGDKKKRLPNLLKISDLKRSDSMEEPRNSTESPPTLFPSFVCPKCPAEFTARSDLFTHLRVKHPAHANLLCGICLYQASSIAGLEHHVDTCSQQHQGQVVQSRFVCRVCKYGEDNAKTLENHVPIHDFLIDTCRRQVRIFDPSDYIDEMLDHTARYSNIKTYTCADCDADDFDSFKEFSAHRRNEHVIFHCDLCNKFYGRNSHLWKHVNRLHKGHPSVTCQLCSKTSASKYHLKQHFNKIHTAKPFKPKAEPDFMNQKFQAFDFQSVKQSFMRQEMAQASEDTRVREEKVAVVHEQVPFTCDQKQPKEIDSSSDLYNSIITNYTAKGNEGEFKCPKCHKGFHKKTLEKKHKKNCRPRLQKDLLTRCKSCARIFKDRQSLAKHLVNYHSEYVCELCGQKVQSKCEIVSHIRFGHPGCHLFCAVCGNILRSQGDLNEHLRNHAESFVCQFCGDALSSKIKLKMHILSLHRKILSLSCGLCLKLFETQHVLRDHVSLVHKSELDPRTTCPVCGKNYGSKWKTYDHLNKSHGRIFKPCKVCLLIFDTEAELQLHIEAIHRGRLSTAAAKSAIPPNIVKSEFPVPTVKPLQHHHNNQSDGESSDSPFNGAAACKDEYDEEDEEDDEEGEEEEEEEEEIAADNEASLSEASDEGLDEGSATGPFEREVSRESKISLLEKRLLGQKIDEIPSVPAGPDVKPIFNISKTNIKKEENFEEMDYEEDYHSSSSQPNLVLNPAVTSQCLNNSNPSKRTVYVNSNDPSFCEICRKTWPAKKHLWQHYIRCHKSVAATVCGICLKTNSSYEILQNHLRETHPTLLHGQGFGSNFICRICGRYHNASSKLRLHMAIHENFDWSLLDSDIKPFTQEQNRIEDSKNAAGHHRKNVRIKEENGYCDEPQNEICGEGDEDINYESLIEQVELSEEGSDVNEQQSNDSNSSSSDESDDDDDDDNDDDDNDEDEDDESDVDGEESENEAVVNEAVNGDDDDESDDNSIEEQMLQNMMNEKRPNEPGNAEVNFEGIEEERDGEDNNGFVTTSDDEGASSSSGGGHSNGYGRCKTEELDSAIQSIKFECVEKNEVDVEEDYLDLQSQMQVLNETEIESAVGSIL